MNAAVRSRIALVVIGILTLGVCSAAEDEFPELSDAEDVGETSFDAISCEADSVGLYEQDFDSDSLGDEFEYFLTRDWNLWE